MCIFALARTTCLLACTRWQSCELLQNVYLCISTYNLSTRFFSWLTVVNCFKMCIFALARTTYYLLCTVKERCELLQNVYLCISTYNVVSLLSSLLPVVNCFKMCIFALARTTVCLLARHNGVVNCFKMCIFALARTTTIDVDISRYSCELLQNVYLCISTYNALCCALITTELWIASKCVSLH